MRGAAALLPLFAACATPAPPTSSPPPPAPAVEKSLGPNARVTMKVATSTACRPAALVREEKRIESEPGIEVFAMRVGAFGETRGAVLFTHGAGSASSSLWDLRTKDYSFMRKLACKGFDAYAVDVRGFGGSTMPGALSQPADENPPVVRAKEVMADVDAVARWAKARSGVARIDLVGWSWGSLVAGMYASTRPESVRRLVLFAPVYDRKWPKRHQTENAWYTVSRDLFFEYYDEVREERAVLEEFVDQLFRFEPKETLRLPNGPYADLYGEDAPIWDASKVMADTLVVRGDQDRASLEPHARKLFADLVNASVRRYVVLGGAGHFAFRTRRYRELQSVVIGFLEER